MKIESMNRISLETVKVTISMDFVEWKNAKMLGLENELYSVDMSNLVYIESRLNALNPLVNESIELGSGSSLKVLELTFLDSVWIETMGELIKVDFVARRRVA